MAPSKRGPEAIDLTNGYDDPRKTARVNDSNFIPGRRFGAPEEYVSLNEAPLSTQAELDDERGAAEMVDSTEGLNEEAYSSFQLYGKLLPLFFFFFLFSHFC